MTGPRWFSLSPRDTLLVRDGRSFEAAGGRAGAEQAQGLAPWPSTVAGALGSAFSGAAGSHVEPTAMRGPLFAHQDALGRWNPYFATPADVVLTARQQQLPRPTANRLALLNTDPGEPSMLTDLHDSPQSLLVSGTDEHVAPAGGWLAADAMTDYLAGQPDRGFPLAPRWQKATENPLVPESRIGLAREGAVAREGYLYAATHLRLRQGWAFLVQCVDSADTCELTPRGPVPFGGKARLADVAAVEGADWPSPPQSFPEGRVLLYVATPALWPGGWRPPLPPDVDIVAASVGEPIPVATASPRTARQTNRAITATALLRWAVPAGSVYWLQFRAASPASPADPADAASRWAAGIHATALGPTTDSGGGSRSPGRRAPIGPPPPASASSSSDDGRHRQPPALPPTRPPARRLTRREVEMTTGTDLLLYLYAESPLHAGGTGGDGVIDLPIQRESTTGYPVVWGQSLKGALRQAATADGWGELVREVFGPEVIGAGSGSGLESGRLSVGDAQLVALPVATLRRTHAWATTTRALAHLARKYKRLGIEPPTTPDCPDDQACAAHAPWLDNPAEVLGPVVASIDQAANPAVGEWAQRIADDGIGRQPTFLPFAEKMDADLLLVGASIASLLAVEGTELVPRVSLTAEKTVAAGPFYSEYLPTESILAATITLDTTPPSQQATTSAHDVMQRLDSLLHGQLLQIGGDESIGKGLAWCRLHHPAQATGAAA